jgi:hypothetical protein
MRSLLTGLPTAFLLGKSEASWAAASDAKFLILSHMSNGDPLNANAPGAYGNPSNANDPLHQIEHATVAELGNKAAGFATPATFMLGNKQVRAAQPWSTLPSDLLARSAFWHHATYTNAHPDFEVVVGLGGALKGPDGSGGDHFGSFVAQENHENLGSLSAELIRIGGSASHSNGVLAPQLSPLTLKSIFGAKVAHFDRMVAMRDHFLDQTYQEVKATGTPAQRKFLDRYASSRQEAQTLGDSLGELLTDITGSGPADQAKMAAALIQLKVAPVITLGMPFGGDNHQDLMLEKEVDETITTIEAFKTLWDKLTFARVQNDVVFASFNVFGRTLKRASNGGRDHNGSHHCMYVFGSTIKAGVVGGLEAYQRRSGPEGIDFKASAINAANGSTSNPNIPFEQTLSSVGKTLATAVGIDAARITKRIDTGRVITGALV